MSESLEMLNSPQDLAAPPWSPKGRIISGATTGCLSASLDICSLAFLYAEESLEPAVCRAHEDSREEMIPFLFFSQHRKSHPITTPHPLNCSLA